MVAVIVVGRYDGADRREHLRLDAVLLQQLAVVGGQQRDFQHAVIQHANVHAFLGLGLQDLQDLSPHVALFNDEILHEDELFGLAQLLQHRGEFVLAQGEVGDLRVFKHGEAAAAVHEGDQVVRGRGVVLQLFHCFLGLGNGSAGPVDQLRHPALDRAVAQVRLGKRQQGHAEEGRDGYDQHPRQLGRGIHVTVEQVDDAADGKQRGDHGEEGQQVPQPGVEAEGQEHLRQQKQRDHKKTTEQQGQQALLPGFGQSVDIAHDYPPFRYMIHVSCCRVYFVTDIAISCMARCFSPFS